MRVLYALVVLLLASPQIGMACQFVEPRPEEILASRDNVVVAYPVGISNVPRLANDPFYLEDFRQTVLWQVVVSWKGSYKPGDRFTTRRNLNRSGMCNPGAGNYSTKPLLLAFSGREPYPSYREFSVELHPDIFLYFQRTFVKNGT